MARECLQAILAYLSGHSTRSKVHTKTLASISSSCSNLTQLNRVWLRLTFENIHAVDGIRPAQVLLCQAHVRDKNECRFQMEVLECFIDVL
jgi:hypothetical protein